MAEITLHAPDIECEGCANSIARALEKINGIDMIDVDIKGKNVAVHYDDTMVDRLRIARALEQIGFPVQGE